MKSFSLNLIEFSRLPDVIPERASLKQTASRFLILKARFSAQMQENGARKPGLHLFR